MDLIHVPLRHKYPALKTLPKSQKWLGRPMDTHLKKNGGASKWSLVKKEPLYTHRFYSCILIFAGRMLICESMSIKEPFQVPGSLSGYQAPQQKRRFETCIYQYMIYISILVSNNDSGGALKLSRIITCSHSGGSISNMLRCNPASNPTSHQEFNPMIQTWQVLHRSKSSKLTTIQPQYRDRLLSNTATNHH